MKSVNALSIILGASAILGAFSQDPLESMDLMCLKGKNAQSWFNIQQKMQYAFGMDAAFGTIDSPTKIRPILEFIMEDLAQIGGSSGDDCGVAKVLIQLLNALAQDDAATLNRLMIDNAELTNPIMTLLVDLPWTSYQPFWPVFGIFSQIAVRRSTKNTEEVDGLNYQDLKYYHSALMTSLAEGRMDALRELSKLYLGAGSEAIQASPIAFITSMFTQAIAAKTIEDARGYFTDAQRLLKQFMQRPGDLDIVLSSQWPVWGLAHLAAMKLN